MKEQTTNTDPSQQPPATLEEVWRLFRDTGCQIKETGLQIKEMAAESKRATAETDRQFKETDRQFKETDRKLNKLEHLFTGHWGKLMESLVEGDLVNVLNRRGITINDTTSRLRGRLDDGGNYEFDIIAHNGDEVVIVEVKTTLRPDDVSQFQNKLNHLKAWVPRYTNNRIYGAMAYLMADAGADTMAENRGLFIIRATGDSAAIVNNEGFKPRSW